MARGDVLIATARDPGSATELLELGCMVVPLDVTSDESVLAFAQAVGDEGIDVLVNNAGLGTHDALGAMDFDAMNRVLDTNVTGPLRVLNALLPQLKKGEATVANISSRMGSIGENSSGGLYAYRISKAALNMAVSVSAIDLKSAAVTVVGLHPGWVKTDMGGPGAQVETADCASALIGTIDGLTLEQTGQFLDRDGGSIPW